MCRDAIYRVRQLFWKAESFVGSAFFVIAADYFSPHNTNFILPLRPLWKDLS